MTSIQFEFILPTSKDPSCGMFVKKNLQPDNEIKNACYNRIKTVHLKSDVWSSSHKMMSESLVTQN